MCRSQYCTHRWFDTDTGALTYAGRQRQLDRTWTDWVVVSNANTTSAQVWGEWNLTTSATTITIQGSTLTVPHSSQLTYHTNAWVTAPPPTDEEIAAAAEAQRLRVEARLQREAELAAAKERAEALLLSCLDEEQRRELRAHDRFHVTAPSGRRYCIKRGRAGNVSARDSANRVVRYCIHDYVGLPDADTMLGQKLMLETDEQEFLATANASY